VPRNFPLTMSKRKRSKAPITTLWAVMKAYGFDTIMVDGVPIQCPPDGPQRYIPVFNTREQAVAWAKSDEHVSPLLSSPEVKRHNEKGQP
jgi:hypothetical protein